MATAAHISLNNERKGRSLTTGLLLVSRYSIPQAAQRRIQPPVHLVARFVGLALPQRPAQCVLPPPAPSGRHRRPSATPRSPPRPAAPLQTRHLLPPPAPLRHGRKHSPGSSATVDRALHRRPAARPLPESPSSANSVNVSFSEYATPSSTARTKCACVLPAVMPTKAAVACESRCGVLSPSR